MMLSGGAGYGFAGTAAEAPNFAPGMMIDAGRPRLRRIRSRDRQTCRRLMRLLLLLLG